jgi:EmrB/QacA subfamily drug resistance transporter
VENHSDEKAVKEEPKEDHPYNGRSKGKVAVIMLALCMAVFLAALDVTIVTTALPTITEHFGSASGYTWIGSAFMLANAASIPSWGKVSDIFGRKPMLLLANIIFMIGSLVAALSNSIGMLIAARAVQGLGGGGLVILVNITIGDLFSLRIRGAFYGIIGGVWAIASSIGPIIGGAFTESVSWRWCFWINLPLDGLAFIILVFFLDIETPKTPLIEGLKAIDWVGSLLVVGATLMFLFGLQYGGETYPWGSATVVCLLVFGALTFALFILYEWKIPKYPVMPLGLFKSRTNIATLSVVFIHGFVFISGSYYLPLYFQAVLGATPILSGVYLLPTALALSAGSIGTGIFVGKTGLFLPPIYLGLFMLTLGYGLFVDFSAHSSWAKIIMYQIVAGVGVGPLFQAPIIALQAHINPRDIGTATATLGFVRQLATSTSVVVGQVVFQNSMSAKTPQLATTLGPELAQRLSGSEAGANTQVINSLPGPQKEAVRVAFADSLVPMWIMYLAFSALGLLVGFCIKKKVLSSQHEETKTGLAAEKENAAARTAEKEAKRASKRASARPSTSDTNMHLGSGETLADDVPPMPEGRPKDLEMGDPEKTAR